MSELKNQELPPLAQAFIVEPIHKGGRVVWEADYIILRNAALNELKAKDTELAAKDARIAELGGISVELQELVDEACTAGEADRDRAEAAEKRIAELDYTIEEREDEIIRHQLRLGAVSEVLKEKLLSGPVRVGSGRMRAYPCVVVDEFFARLRSIVEGK